MNMFLLNITHENISFLERQRALCCFKGSSIRIRNSFSLVTPVAVKWTAVNMMTSRQEKFYKHKTSTDQKFITERVIIDVVCSSRRLVNSLTGVTFIMVVFGENAFWVLGGFFIAIPRVTTGKNCLQGATSSSYYTSMLPRSPPCFYRSPEQTNQTLTPETAFCVLHSHRRFSYTLVKGTSPHLQPHR